MKMCKVDMKMCKVDMNDTYPSDSGPSPCYCTIWPSDPHPCILLQFPQCIG